ncbi:mannosyl-oligosaccharide 1,3-1,6-alpha-mannosidase activity protein [Coemansia sp. Benny D115]|nr:mannosyl-oligosaccharide 1,3-1,6-alpha-mannosidase activity protein [Coemansia sp. Benny D115]
MAHSDIGWNLSFEEYYHSSVHRVMRQVVKELWLDSRGTKRFTWGDLAFFDLWMSDEGDKQAEGLPEGVTWRRALQDVVASKKMDVVGGGYVSPDEGMTTWWAHQQIIDVGRRTLTRLFGSNFTTTTGWQIDNFGHTRITPYLLHNSGFKQMVLGRMDYRTLYDMSSKSGLQFNWTMSPKDHGLLTHFLSTHYAFPSKMFDFDHTSNCNTENLVEELLRYMRSQVRQYPAHGHLMVMMGDDFRYVKAARAFRCLDRLVDDASSPETKLLHPGVAIRYSTPSEYFTAIRPYLKNHSLSKHAGDFYPYQDKPYEQYWSGILASRPYLKWLVRSTEQTVHNIESLIATTRLHQLKHQDMGDLEWWTVLERHLEYTRKQVAIGYHHDAITGTCTDQTALDYVRRMQSATNVAIRIGHYVLRKASGEHLDSSEIETELSGARKALKEATNKLGYNTAVQDRFVVDFSTQDQQRADSGRLEIPEELCSSQDSEKASANNDMCQGALVVVSNAALAAQDQVVRLRVHRRAVELVDAQTNAAVPLVEVSELDAPWVGQYEVAFLAQQVPPFGFRSYTLRAATPSAAPSPSPLMPMSMSMEVVPGGVVELAKNGTRVVLSLEDGGNSGRVRMVVEQQGQRRVLKHQLRQYAANPYVQASGAYVMHSFMLMFGPVFYVLGGGLLLGLVVGSIRTNAVLGGHRYSQPQLQSQSQLNGQPRASVAVVLGILTGVLTVYIVGQKVGYPRLTNWAAVRDTGVFIWVGGTGFSLSTTLSWRLRWRNTLCMVFFGAAALSAVYTLFFIPEWQSRTLNTDTPAVLHVRHGELCDSAFVQVTKDAQIEYRLCADRSDLVQVTTRLTAAPNREVVGRFEAQDRKNTVAALLGTGCRFTTFDGVAMIDRQYRRWTPLPGNYYPAVSHVALAGAGPRLALHSRQATGATCPEPGVVEVMLHRHMTGNDYRGLVQPLTDSVPAAVTHFIDVSPQTTEAGAELATNALVNMPPLAFVLAPDTQQRQRLAYHSGVNVDGVSENTRRWLRIVGVRAETADGAGGDRQNGTVLFARLQAVGGSADGQRTVVDVDGSGLFSSSAGFSVKVQEAEHGDWSITTSNQKASETRSSTKEGIKLADGEQRLYRVTVDITQKE